MQSQGVPLWGVADIRPLCFSIGKDPEPYPGAVSWAIPMPPDIMAGIKNGPTQAYARAYTEVNVRITEMASIAVQKPLLKKDFVRIPWRHQNEQIQ